MSFDPVAKFVATKNAYARMRGGTGFGSKVIPKTAYGDVITFYALFTAAADKGDFVKTTSYLRAFYQWQWVVPWHKDPDWALRLTEEYPWNEEFWTYGLQFAIARSAAGEVPGKWDIAIESVSEAVSELPATVSNAIDKANPLNFIPKLSPLAEIIKWGSVGGGLFLLYWYVLRKPKKK